MENNRNKYFIGKVKDYAKRKGWFFGHFMDEKLLKSEKVEVAWQDISNKKPEKNDKHYHKSSVEINIVISGWVKAGINGTTSMINPDEFYIVYPYATVDSIEAGENTQLICIRAPSLPDDKFVVE